MDDAKLLLKHLQEANERLAAGPPVDFDPSVHGDFLYPIAWLDRHCERASNSFRLEPGAITMVAVAAQQWLLPVAWTIDAYDLTDRDLPRNLLMCGAWIGPTSQFNFYCRDGELLDDRTQGIETAQLAQVHVHGYPCAPACMLEVMGPERQGQHLQVAIGNRNHAAAGGTITVWGKPSPTHPCGVHNPTVVSGTR